MIKTDLITHHWF